jgi:hypothetical protein
MNATYVLTSCAYKFEKYLKPTGFLFNPPRPSFVYVICRVAHKVIGLGANKKPFTIIAEI